MVSIYYAHPKFMYGTKYEERDISAITKHFPDAKITNPAEIRYHHQRRMEVYAYYASLHDIIVYRPVVGKFVTAGICEEIEAGFWSGTKVMRIYEKDDSTFLEEVDKLKDYPLNPKETNLLGKALSLVDEPLLIEQISSLRSRHRLTPKSALILICTKVVAEKLGKRWIEILRHYMKDSGQIPKHWLKIIKKEKAREEIQEMISRMENDVEKLIISACLKFSECLELKSRLIGKYASLPERILAYNYALKLRHKGLSYEEIAKELREIYDVRISAGQVCNWISGRHNPLRRCGKIIDKPELAYVIAAWLGDGSLAVDLKRFKHYVRLISSSFEFAKEWGRCLAIVMGNRALYNPKWDSYSKRWVTKASNILLWMILTIAKEDPWFVRDILEKYPEASCKGWFDAEGGVNVSGHKIFGINTDIQQIKLFQELLNNLSINSRWYSRLDKGSEFRSPRSGRIYKRNRDNYDLIIFGKDNQLRYKELIGFRISEKQRKLDILLGSVSGSKPIKRDVHESK